MTRTSFEPKVSKVSVADIESHKKRDVETTKSSIDSKYSTVSGNKWKAMTESEYETPSVIDEMISGESTDNAAPTARSKEQAYLGSFMCGDDGCLETATNENLKVADHETLEIPSAKELCGLSKVNIYPILQRYQVLKKTISDLIKQNTESLLKGGLTDGEAAGIKDYLKYLHSCMAKVEKEYEVANYYWLNELHDRDVAKAEAEANNEWWN